MKILLKRQMTLGFTGIAGFHFWDGRDPKEDGSYHTELWKNTFRAQNHMNGDDVISTLSDGWGDWWHGMGAAEYKNNLREKYSVEHQYYKSSDKRKAVGYVKNRSFNINTRGNAGTECSGYPFNNTAVESPRNTEWNDVYLFKRLRINNLKTHTEYKIDWYSNNQYIKTDCIETNKKDGIWGITLEYPELTVSHTGNNDLPVVWYVIQQQSCSSGMVQQDDIEEVEEGMNRKQLLNNQENNETILNVHPNPFQNHISIQSPQKDELILKSIEGKIIDNYEIEKGQSRVNTANFSSGMYILTFINQNRSFKLIKL
ncbi:T9SS type A sorting domain-containing protein [Brumimicrobium aurantiacum]|nr:T9SS type A sorting domain-containing protein [Brumimicrobium aurantiacum]